METQTELWLRVVSVSQSHYRVCSEYGVNIDFMWLSLMGKIHYAASCFVIFACVCLCLCLCVCVCVCLYLCVYVCIYCAGRFWTTASSPSSRWRWSSRWWPWGSLAPSVTLATHGTGWISSSSWRGGCSSLLRPTVFLLKGSRCLFRGTSMSRQRDTCGKVCVDVWSSAWAVIDVTVPVLREV